ncbi:hypothetical protein J6590_056179 [Homalodisca vitripennis]|nr:hypothetical protein J6590_056179 [Homalodisca vitripennis]
MILDRAFFMKERIEGYERRVAPADQLVYAYSRVSGDREPGIIKEFNNMEKRCLAVKEVPDKLRILMSSHGNSQNITDMSVTDILCLNRVATRPGISREFF